MSLTSDVHFAIASRITSDQNITGNLQTLVFNKTVKETGVNHDTSTGKFTLGKDANYLVCCAACVKPQSGSYGQIGSQSLQSIVTRDAGGGREIITEDTSFVLSGTNGFISTINFGLFSGLENDVVSFEMSINSQTAALNDVASVTWAAVIEFKYMI